MRGRWHTADHFIRELILKVAQHRYPSPFTAVFRLRLLPFFFSLAQFHLSPPPQLAVHKFPCVWNINFHRRPSLLLSSFSLSRFLSILFLLFFLQRYSWHRLSSDAIRFIETVCLRRETRDVVGIPESSPQKKFSAGSNALSRTLILFAAYRKHKSNIASKMRAKRAFKLWPAAEGDPTGALITVAARWISRTTTANYATE